MGMIKCPDCGKEISDMAVNCPNCGRPMSTQKPVNVQAGVPIFNGVQSPPIKKKKGHGCLISIIVFIFFCTILGFMIPSSPKSEENSNKGSEQEKKNVDEAEVLSKEDAGELDEKVWDMATKVIDANNKLMETMDAYANGSVSEYDFYSYAKEVADYCGKASVSFPSSKDKNAKAYIDSCADGALFIQMAANSIVKYLDEKSNENLAKVEQSIKDMNSAVTIAASNRGVFLKLSGFSDDEIKAIADKMDETAE